MNEEIQYLIERLAADLTQMAMQEYGWDMLKALDVVYGSKTFEKVTNPKFGLFYQGSVYVFDYLKSEIETGKIA